MTAAPVDLCRLARERGVAGSWAGPSDLGLLLVTGPDSAAFLQARLTSDVLSLGAGRGQLSAKLTGRGELVSYFSLHRLPERGQPFPSFFLLAPRPEIALLLEDLGNTVISEEVHLEDVSTQFEGFLVQGPAADEVIAGLAPAAVEAVREEYSLEVPTAGDIESQAVPSPPDLMILARSFTGDPGRLLLWGGGGSGDSFAEHCRKTAADQGLGILGTSALAETAWRWLTVEAGWLALGRDLVPGKAVLPRTGLEQLVASATKGCYPGQEVVARIRTYGSVPTALRGLVFGEGTTALVSELPEPGSILTHDGRKIGSWGTGAWSVTRDRLVALAFLDRNHRTPGTRLSVRTGAGMAEAEVTLLPFYRAADQSQKARHLYDRAIRLFSEGDDKQAVDILQQALRLDPGLTDAYEALGVILGRGERYLEAIDIFRRLEEVAPAEPMVHTNLSLFYMKIGDKDEAERQKSQGTLKRFAGAADPAEAMAMQEMAESARREDALRRQAMFAEVLELDPADPLALMGMGKALADLEDFTEADRYLEEALTAQPDNSSLYAARGKVLEALDRAREAGEVYRQGVAVASRRGDLMPLKDMEHRLLMLGDR